MEKREREAQCVQWRRVAHVRCPCSPGNFLKPYSQAATGRWMVMLGSVFRLQRKKKRHCYPFSAIYRRCHGRGGEESFSVSERGRSALCFLMRFSPWRRLFMSASQSVLLIYKPSRDVQEWKKACVLPCACCVVFLFLVFRFQTPGHAGRWEQRQAAPDADWESGFGYGGAGDSPIGLKLFEWASLEQSQAPPPPKTELIQLPRGRAGRGRGKRCTGQGPLLDTLSDPTDKCARRYLITCTRTQRSKEDHGLQLLSLTSI